MERFPLKADTPQRKEIWKRFSGFCQDHDNTPKQRMLWTLVEQAIKNPRRINYKPQYIEGVKLDIEINFLDHVINKQGMKYRYGVIINIVDTGVVVLYSDDRDTQITDPRYLVWG